MLRVFCLLLALALVGAGVLGALVQRSASDPLLRDYRRPIQAFARQSKLPPALQEGALPYGLAGAGLLVAVGALLAGRRARAEEASPGKPPAQGGRAPELAVPVLDRRSSRKLERQALAMARKGMV